MHFIFSSYTIGVGISKLWGQGGKGKNKKKRKKKAEITWPIASGAGLYREGRCVFVLLRVSAFFLSHSLVIKDGQHKQQFEIQDEANGVVQLGRRRRGCLHFDYSIRFGYTVAVS